LRLAGVESFSDGAARAGIVPLPPYLVAVVSQQLFTRQANRFARGLVCPDDLEFSVLVGYEFREAIKDESVFLFQLLPGFLCPPALGLRRFQFG
jgi:hypothetical protein